MHRQVGVCHGEPEVPPAVTIALQIQAGIQHAVYLFLIMQYVGLS